MPRCDACGGKLGTRITYTWRRRRAPLRWCDGCRDLCQSKRAARS